MKPVTRGARGASLIEILVSLVICAFGLLGYVGMQSRAATMEFESYQRSQAMVILEDMVGRLSASRTGASGFVSAGVIGGGPVEDCTGKVGSALDVCEWGNLLRGAAETRGGSTIGAMTGARGCIQRANGTQHNYIISVVWNGTSSTGGPKSTCGKGTAAFPDETLRRVVSTDICIARLDNAAAPLKRC